MTTKFIAVPGALFEKIRERLNDGTNAELLSELDIVAVRHWLLDGETQRFPENPAQLQIDLGQ